MLLSNSASCWSSSFTVARFWADFLEECIFLVLEAILFLVYGFAIGLDFPRERGLPGKGKAENDFTAGSGAVNAAVALLVAALLWIGVALSMVAAVWLSMVVAAVSVALTPET